MAEGLFNIREEMEEIEAVQEVIALNNELYPHPKVYLERQDPFAIYSDNQFRQRYRMTKETARYVVNLIQPRLTSLRGNLGRPVCPDIQVLATIRYLAKGAYEQDVADQHGFHQSTLSRIIKTVVEALAELRPRFIKFPNTPEDLHQAKDAFFAIAGCPSIIAAIDGTQVKIKNPGGEYPLLYMNRKGYYSLNVQAVCDAHCRIIDIVARWRGSVHDSRIWNECRLKTKFDNGEINGILVGDNGYPCSRYLLTPILNPTTAAERRYNHAHIRTRNVVERTFGILKNKFRCFFNGLQINLETAKTTIIALAVLHNICLNEELPENEEEIGDGDEGDGNVPVNAVGNICRRQYIERYFNK